MSARNLDLTCALAAGMAVGTFICSLTIASNPDDAMGVAAGGFIACSLLVAFLVGAYIARATGAS